MGIAAHCCTSHHCHPPERQSTLVMTADDLEDGLVYDMDAFLDASQPGSDQGSESDTSINPTQKESPHEPQGESQEQVTKKGSKKRLHESTKFQEKKKIKMQIDVDRKKGLSTEASVDAIIDYINDALRRKNSDLSSLELADLYFKKSEFRSTADYSEPRVLDNLPKFIMDKFSNMLPSKTPGKTNKKGKKRESSKGEEDSDERKFIAILSMSALRACDVHRALREIPGSSLKLINKNKLDVDLKLVKSTWARVLCCTPGRLQKVLNNEDASLRKEEIKIVILDNSYLDQKMQNVWNIPETFDTVKELTDSNSKVYLY